MIVDKPQIPTNIPFYDRLYYTLCTHPIPWKMTDNFLINGLLRPHSSFSVKNKVK